MVLEFSHHELDDVMKTLTVIDDGGRSGSSVAAVDVPTIGDKDRRVPIGVKLSGGNAHDRVSPMSCNARRRSARA